MKRAICLLYREHPRECEAGGELVAGCDVAGGDGATGALMILGVLVLVGGRRRRVQAEACDAGSGLHPTAP